MRKSLLILIIVVFVALAVGIVLILQPFSPRIVQPSKELINHMQPMEGKIPQSK